MAMGRVAGKIAWVTGAGSGIGAATAKLLAREGTRAFCSEIDAKKVTEICEHINKDGQAAFAMPFDVIDESGWRLAADRIKEHFGHLDVLVNCAGISFGAPAKEMIDNGFTV